jgi:hypothetical protein
MELKHLKCCLNSGLVRLMFDVRLLFSRFNCPLLRFQLNDYFFKLSLAERMFKKYGPKFAFSNRDKK